MVEDSFVTRLAAHVDFTSVCPEVEIGLGTPRASLRIASSDGRFILIQPASGLDVTSKMRDFSQQFLANVGEVDGFILKNRSPSCGIADVKFYAGPEKAAAIGRTHGVFGGTVLEKFCGLAIEDEGRLRNLAIREHFLKRIFASARFRTMRASGSIADLVAFHAAHKLLLMACNQTRLRELGRIVANADRKPAVIVFDLYAQGFRDAFQRLPRHASPINVLMHALGYFQESLVPREKQHFLAMLEAYRKGREPLSSAVSVFSSWIIRFENAYLAQQTFFQPFPDELTGMSDSAAQS
jgi:uncharacterized protein YbgA (DUF1722 family)/uncharacterized protein YbbK (DUF523 family)